MVARGEIVWADLDPVEGHEQGGRRPVLVVSGQVFNERSGTLVVFPLTSKPPHLGFPFTIAVPPGIVAKPSWVKLTQVRTIDDRRVRGALGRTPPIFVDHCLHGLLKHCQP